MVLWFFTRIQYYITASLFPLGRKVGIIQFCYSTNTYVPSLGSSEGSGEHVGGATKVGDPCPYYGICYVWVASGRSPLLLCLIGLSGA